MCSGFRRVFRRTPGGIIELQYALSGQFFDSKEEVTPEEVLEEPPFGCFQHQSVAVVEPAVSKRCSCGAVVCVCASVLTFVQSTRPRILRRCARRRPTDVLRESGAADGCNPDATGGEFDRFMRDLAELILGPCDALLTQPQNLGACIEPGIDERPGHDTEPDQRDDKGHETPCFTRPRAETQTRM